MFYVNPYSLKTASDKQLQDTKNIIDQEIDKRKKKKQSIEHLNNQLKAAVEAVNTGDEYCVAKGLALLYQIQKEAKLLKKRTIVNATQVQLPQDFDPHNHAQILKIFTDEYPKKKKEDFQCTHNALDRYFDYDDFVNEI